MQRNSLHKSAASAFPLLLAFFFFLGCEERIKPSVMTDLRTKELPSQESWNTTITFSDSGVTKAILRVGHLVKFDERQSTLIDGGLKVDFFDAGGNHTSVLTSSRGVVDDRTNDLEAIGSVVVVSDSGTTLQTERLFWKNSLRRVQSDEFVKIISPKEEIQGQGFDSDENLTNYKIYRVTGRTSMAK